jgi:hypothetical protein
VSITIDVLPKSNGAAAWPEFLQSAGSPRTGAQLKAKLTRIQKTDRPPEPDRAEQLSNKAPFLWWHDSRLTGIRDSRIQRVIRANGSPMQCHTGKSDGEYRSYATLQSHGHPEPRPGPSRLLHPANRRNPNLCRAGEPIQVTLSLMDRRRLIAKGGSTLLG